MTTCASAGPEECVFGLVPLGPFHCFVSLLFRGRVALWKHVNINDKQFLCVPDINCTILLFSRKRKGLLFPWISHALLRLLPPHPCHRHDRLLRQESQHEGLLQPCGRTEIQSVANAWNVPTDTLFISPNPSSHSTGKTWAEGLGLPGCGRNSCKEPGCGCSWLGARRQRETFCLKSRHYHGGAVTAVGPWCVYTVARSVHL